MALLACRSVLPQSPQANIVIGLDLLRLLVENRIAEFHTELELLSPEVTLPSVHHPLTMLRQAYWQTMQQCMKADHFIQRHLPLSCLHEWLA